MFTRIKVYLHKIFSPFKEFSVIFTLELFRSPTSFPSCCEGRCTILSEVYYSLSFEVFLLKSHLSWLFMVLGAALDFFKKQVLKKITYLSYITRNLEVGSHWHGFMNSILTGSASVQLFWTFPQGCQVVQLQPLYLYLRGRGGGGGGGRARRRGEEQHQLYLCVYWEG